MALLLEAILSLGLLPYGWVGQRHWEERMGSIELKKVEKWFNEVNVIKGIDLRIHDGEFLVLVGPSGCGKSTLLRMIGGLEDTSMGDIVIDGQVVTNFPPSKRGLSMVFQSYALYPHLTVEENMGFPLKTAGEKKNVIKNHVNKVAKVLKLENYSNRLPKTLSGGQRQRVAIGRSIVRNPTAFLFDEPLSNLDAALRVDMRLELTKLHQELKATMIYVTHDQVEAMTLADRIVVLDSGSISQIGTPKDLYEMPQNLFVAQFIGSPKMNIINYRDIFKSSNIDQELKKFLISKKHAKYIGIRAEDIKIAMNNKGHVRATIDVIEYLGADTFVIANAGNLGGLRIRCESNSKLKNNLNIGLKLDLSKIHFFDVGGRNLNI